MPYPPAQQFQHPMPLPKKPIDPAKREQNALTLLYTVGAGILLAGLVLLVSLFIDPPTSLLLYFFGLGVAVIAMIFILRGRSTDVGVAIQIVGTGLGLAAVASSWQSLAVTPIVGLLLATLLAGVATISGRLAESPAALVWVAWLAVAFDLWATDAFTSALVGAMCLAAMVGKGWPRHQVAVAAATALAGFQGLTNPDPVWLLVWLVPTVVMTLWLVHFHQATPMKPSPRPVPRPSWVLASRGERGGQPWALALILLPAAWFVTLVAPELPDWVPLVMAGVILAAGLLLPEPVDAVDKQGLRRDVVTIMGTSSLGFTLLLGRLDSVVEPIAVLVLAISLQFVPVVKSQLTWVSRAVPTVLAVIAGRDAVLSVWGFPPDLVSDPFTIAQGVLLTLLGAALLISRQGPPHPVVDSARLLGGLYLCVHGVVLAASLIGFQLGSLQDGFLVGHAVASLAWMSCAAYLALRKESAATLTLALVVALGAAAKLVLFDMAALSGPARVAAFMGCGAIMVAIAFLRQRRHPGPPQDEDQVPPQPAMAPPPGATTQNMIQ